VDRIREVLDVKVGVFGRTCCGWVSRPSCAVGGTLFGLGFCRSVLGFRSGAHFFVTVNLFVVVFPEVPCRCSIDLAARAIEDVDPRIGADRKLTVLVASNKHFGVS
jgi:hypothetical protein